jgi:hypothetical protein
MLKIRKEELISHKKEDMKEEDKMAEYVNNF